MKAIFMRKWAMPILTLLLAFAGIGGVKAQVVGPLNSDGTANVNIYIHFENEGIITVTPSLWYGTGTSGNPDNVTEAEVSDHTIQVLGRSYYKATVKVPYDAVNKCLAAPIYIPRNYLRWKEGIISTYQGIDNTMWFYGDAYIHIDRRSWWGIRYDNAIADEFMEENRLYAYDTSTGLSTPLEPDIKGYCSWEVDTQSPLRHVGTEDSRNSTAVYPLTKEVVIARKSAYRSYEYTLPESTDKVNGGAFLPRLDANAENLKSKDVLHAYVNGGTDVTLNTFSEVNEDQDWPTEGITSTRTCIVSTQRTNAYDGFVGHLKFIVTPKKWKTEAWIAHEGKKANGGWATFCSPYYDVAVPQGLLILAVTNRFEDDTTTPDKDESERINIETRADYPFIPKGTGVLTKGGGEFKFRPYAETISSTDEAEFKSPKNYMKSVNLNEIDAVPYTAPEGFVNYVFTWDGEAPVFLRAAREDFPGNPDWNDGATTGFIPPYKAYLQMPVSSGGGARYLYPVLPDETLSIAHPSATNADKTVIYDLSGRRYNSTKGLKPGLYIVNGKKCYINR